MPKLITNKISLELQAQILQLLNWSQEDLAAFIYEVGMEYLSAYFKEDEEAIDRLSRRREFWNWFKNHWSYRDQSFFESFVLDQCSHSYRLLMYRTLHSPSILACDIFPSRQVLGNDFHTIKTLMPC